MECQRCAALQGKDTAYLYSFVTEVNIVVLVDVRADVLVFTNVGDVFAREVGCRRR
jgi:hypothetical protein